MAESARAPPFSFTPRTFRRGAHISECGTESEDDIVAACLFCNQTRQKAISARSPHAYRVHVRRALEAGKRSRHPAADGGVHYKRVRKPPLPSGLSPMYWTDPERLADNLARIRQEFSDRILVETDWQGRPWLLSLPRWQK
jgi:hypothetical protein